MDQGRLGRGQRLQIDNNRIEIIFFQTRTIDSRGITITQ